MADIIYYWKEPESQFVTKKWVIDYTLWILMILVATELLPLQWLTNHPVTINGQQIYLDAFLIIFFIICIIIIVLFIYKKYGWEKGVKQKLKKLRAYIQVFDDRLEIKNPWASYKLNIFGDTSEYADTTIYYKDIKSLRIEYPNILESIKNFWGVGRFNYYRKYYRDLYITKIDGSKIKFPELTLRDFFEIEMKKRGIDVKVW